jgi:hypothetical protein
MELKKTKRFFWEKIKAKKIQIKKNQLDIDW